MDRVYAAVHKSTGYNGIQQIGYRIAMCRANSPARCVEHKAIVFWDKARRMAIKEILEDKAILLLSSRCMGRTQ